MTMSAEVTEGQLAELVKQVQAGNEVLLTLGDTPVARIIRAGEAPFAPGRPLSIGTFKGHRVLTPVIRQEELADEMFAP